MPQSADAPGWPQGDGEMARLIRGHDWAVTPMGPLDAWPQSVRTTLDLLLASGSPMVALWGPDLVQIYNDRCRRIMRHRHPAGFGEPARARWPELCHIGEPLYERVLAGETLTQEDVLCPIDRGGALEDAWFTLSCSPLRDEGGTVMGVLVTLIETTAQRLADRALRKSREQQAFLLRYADAFRALDDPVAIQGEAARLLREHLDAGWCSYVEWDGTGLTGRALRDSTREGLPSMMGVHDLSDAPELTRLLRSGQLLNVSDIATCPLLDPRVLDRYTSIGIRSVLSPSLA